MADILKDLYEIVERRKAEREEGSYTVYLLDSGLDKILKKLGEETTETIIAAKNLERYSNTVISAPGTNGMASGAKKEEDAKTADDIETAREALNGEVSDLIYHLVIMLHALGVEPDEIETLLRARMQKTGNLKKTHSSDHNS